MSRHRTLGKTAQAQALGVQALPCEVRLLPGQRLTDDRDRLPHLGERALEGHPVPTLDDRVAGGAQAQDEAVVRELRQARGEDSESN